MEPDARRRRLGRAVVAGRTRRARGRRPRAARLPGGDEPAAGAGPGERDRRLEHRAGDHALRHRRAEGALPRSRCCAATRSGRKACPSPTPGSDLASLRTSAVEDGDHFVVNGQKTWNSHGPLRRLVPALRAHRPVGQEARRHHLLPGRPAHAGHRGAAAHHHHRRSGLRRALLHRRPHPALGHARRSCTPAGRWP